MNREETKEAIEVMQAYVDGEEIETNLSDLSIAWWVNRNPDWSFTRCRYRIKPKPLECWANVYSDGFFNTFLTKEAAVKGKATVHERVAVHMREVTE